MLLIIFVVAKFKNIFYVAEWILIWVLHNYWNSHWWPCYDIPDTDGDFCVRKAIGDNKTSALRAAAAVDSLVVFIWNVTNLYKCLNYTNESKDICWFLWMTRKDSLRSHRYILKKPNTMLLIFLYTCPWYLP